MCGIVGYIGPENAVPKLITGLRRLEYRGYDSAGIAWLEQGDLKLKKEAEHKKSIDKLEDSGQLEKACGQVGIAHTRWATHGEPNKTNAHPHTDCDKQIALVHNGIIENYREIKAGLISKGHAFYSDTDTEVIAHLIEDLYAGDLETAVRQALKQLRGTYGLVVISVQEPDKIVFARMGSPLILGVGEGEYIIASDPAAIVEHTKRVIFLEDGEMGVATFDDYSITTLEEVKVRRECDEIDWDISQAEKGGYPHFMLKEIYEQPEAIRAAIAYGGRLDQENATAKLGGLIGVEDRLRGMERCFLISCGTSHYASRIGALMLEEYAKLPSHPVAASEFRYIDHIINPRTLVIAISQSGETADTLEAIREAKSKGALTLGIVNVVGSTIARDTFAGVYNHAGPEICVASTKAFVSQLTILSLMALLVSRQREHGLSWIKGKRLLESIEELPGKIEEVLAQADSIREVALKYKSFRNFLFLGRKYDCPVAMEGALKLKEISYRHAEGYAAGEMKHGPIALITKHFPSVVLAPRLKNSIVYDKMVSNIQEIKARKGPVIAVTTENNDLEEMVDDVIYIPKTMEMLNPIVSVVALQLFAYYVAVALGKDPDRPRNLAKSVTVE